MRQKKFWFALIGIMAVLAVVLMLPTGAMAASKYKVLHRFKGKDGANPFAGLIFDTAGNLYGTTAGGGARGNGTAFKMTPNADGSWTESVLYSFTGGADGREPYAGLTFDAAGNLYGTTQYGGAFLTGTVFKLISDSRGSWTESVLHSFTGGADGGYPYSALIFDGVGNL